ncbi:MAG: hypothetical protein R6U19_07015, partial [Bacteroidales bacterium]
MEERKKDHISLAINSATSAIEKDSRFVYEPLLAAFPGNDHPAYELAGKLMKYPFWISSMTGGTKMARKINSNLARLAGEFGFGMGLG